MPIPEWPSTLPQELLISGHKETAAANTLRTPMDVGPAKVRRRSTAAVMPLEGQIKITKSQLETFKAFFHDDLLDGSLRFSWVLPSDGVTAVEMRFTDPPEWSAAQEPDYFLLSMKLEVLP